MNRSHGAAAILVAAASGARWFPIGQLSEDPGPDHIYWDPGLDGEPRQRSA